MQPSAGGIPRPIVPATSSLAVAGQAPSSPTELPQLYEPTSPGDEEVMVDQAPLVIPPTYETSVPTRATEVPATIEPATIEPPEVPTTEVPPLPMPPSVPTTRPMDEVEVDVPLTLEQATIEPPSTEAPPTQEPLTLEPTQEPVTLEPPTEASLAGLQPPPAEAETPAAPLLLMFHFPDAPYPPPPKFKTEFIRSLRALGASRLENLALRLREGLLAEVRGPPAALAGLRALQLQNLRVMRHRMTQVQGPGTEASLKWFRQKACAPTSAPEGTSAPSLPTGGIPQSPATLEASLPTRLPGVLPSPATFLGEQHSLPTFLGPPGTPSEMTQLTPTAHPGEPHSAVTRVHSRTPGFSPATGQQSPTEVFSLQPGATGTPVERKRGRGFRAPPTPEGRIVAAGASAPGTPTYSPTEFFAEPSAATPQDSAVSRALKRAALARAPSAERGEGVSSPTYFEADNQMPLPPTPTYSAGSSPTYVEENEPPTPTLEADDDDFGDDVSVADWVASATPKVIQSGTPQSGGPLTPLAARMDAFSSRQPLTPVHRLAVANLARHNQQMRLPGMESPTPTYEPDDETVYGDDASSVASWVASATPRGYDGTSTPMSLPGTPVSVGPGTPLAGAARGTPLAAQPPTPEGEEVPHGFEAAAGTPVDTTDMATVQPGTPTEQPGTPQEQAYDPFGVPATSTGAASSSAAASGAPGMPALASEVFGERGKRKATGGAESADEELPPWKRRAQRRRKQ